MKKYIMNILIITLFISCNEEKSCYLGYFDDAIIFPEKYAIIECSPDIYDIAVHFKFDKKDISSFIQKNKFESYEFSNTSNPHKYFTNQMKEYFTITKKIDINNTFFFKMNDNKKNYLTCLLTNGGDFYGLLEKGTSLPPNWRKTK